jgi:hypothetical protein
MSEPSQDGGGVRARYSRWRATVRGRKTLKAAYAQAARDVKRMDPAVRERIGRANLTKADLQQLASFHVDAQFRPGRYGDMSQRLGQAANTRLQQAGPAPRQGRQTRNPLRQIVNRYSRWGRNERRGTKALKAALTQASKDVKRTDPRVLQAIGRSTLNRSDLAALAAGRMDQVFRPEGRFQGVPGQQQGRGQAQGAGIQSRDAVRQVPAQSEQMTQRIIALQQSILENQQRQMTLMEENNRLQAQMRQMLEARVQQLQQQVTDGQQAVSPPELTQQPEIDPTQQSPEGRQPQLNTDDHVRLDNPVVPANDGPQGEQQSETGEQAAAPGDQEVSGEAQGQAGDDRAATAETLDTSEAFTRISEGDQSLAGAVIDENGAPVLTTPEPAEPRTENDGVQTDGEAAAQEPAQAEPTAETPQPTAEAQQPGTNPQQPAADGQQAGTDPQRPAVDGQRSGGDPQQAQGVPVSAATRDTEHAMRVANEGRRPPSVSSPQQAGDTAKGAGEETGRPRGTGTSARSTNTPKRNGRE